ncbi:nickel/cobalt efflux transporter [Devosia sp. 66-22]|uniref:nickel/cobalt efflux transporter n=1 Tax=Devosia sp. 66-22 TaxID=1895753 RepID=UPI000929F83B|nr:nickel/cobalt efflux transporter [Devosia sp. 66-22]OJX46548.1 MAG: nickel/cobalt efflux protein RcnA [Devosia sp. 66-22]
MTGFAELIAQSATNAWFFMPSAILLGALHGLEPGHSKTMMAAFIVAIRGTVWQAVLLGVAATISHTLIVWVIALGGLYFYQGLDAETVEPYFQLLSALIIIGLALWMIQRAYQDQQAAKASAEHDHPHRAHGHDHDHGYSQAHDEWQEVNTGHGVVRLEIFEVGQPPRWRFRTLFGDKWKAAEVAVTTERPDGSRQTFQFVDRGDFYESADEIPEPHEFGVRLSLSHGSHSHDYDLTFTEVHRHDSHHQEQGLEVATEGYQDSHELAHANDIRRRFESQNVTTWQIVLFGITGGLLPCPAAITVLLICLQLKELTLGAVLVLCFSIGLAITLVAVGAAAAIASRQATKRLPWLSALAARAPYLSGVLIILVGFYVGYTGYVGLTVGHT